MQALFPKGNFDTWKFEIEVYLPKAIKRITTEVDPVMMAALLALTGSETQFSRDTANVQQSERSVITTLTYKVPSFKTNKASEDDLNHDRQFIASYLSQIPDLQVTNLNIDVNKGLVIVTVNIPIGWKV